MQTRGHFHPSDLQGLGRLSVDATVGVANLVEAMHGTILRSPSPFGPSPSGRTSGITGLVYRSVRGVTRLVGASLDAVLAPIVPLFGAPVSSPARDAVLAALNGVVGDHLADTSNPLAIPMRLRRTGRPLELGSSELASVLPRATGRVVLLVHGLCRSDLCWPNRRAGTSSDGRACHEPSLLSRLESELGFTGISLHYNSGRHISTNGRELAALLDTLVARWPLPIEELVIVAHSMGGLVARSACHYGAEAGREWLQHLRTIVFLATPHHGAPLERGGQWVDLILRGSPYSAPFARLGQVRSAGITDLRFGSLLDEDWQGHDRFGSFDDHRRVVPLPGGVRCCAIAATTDAVFGQVGKVVGDGLVPVASALGSHRHPARDLGLAPSERWVGHGLGHLEVLDHPAVSERVVRWLAAEAHPRR